MDRETVLQKLAAAQDHFTQGREHIRQGRKLLFEIGETKGFETLGYASMRQLIQAECRVKKSQGYREITAGQIENTITGEVGNLPERWLRELKDLKDDPVVLKFTHQLAQQTAATLGVKPSASIYRGACETAVELRDTGVITVDEHQIPVNRLHLLEASTINKTAEILARQIQHIRDRMNAKGKQLFKAEGNLSQVLATIQGYIARNGDQSVITVVYGVIASVDSNSKPA